MTVLDFLKENIVHLDGGMGTLLQKKGLQPGEHPEMWNITHPEVIRDIHLSYYNSGSNIVCTNTFGANSLKFDDSTLEEIIKCAVKNTRDAINLSEKSHPKFVALDIGPTGKLLKPLGNLDFEDAVDIFKKTVLLGVKYGVDLIFIETMNDSYETKAALLAAKECCDLPVFVSNAYSENGKLMTGASPEAMVALLEGMGADAIGCNCSLGPKQLGCIIDELLKYASVPVLFKPNAGLPSCVDGETKFDITPIEFADEVFSQIKNGVRICGGCCGTTPEYINELSKRTKDFAPVKTEEKSYTCVSSFTHCVYFDKKPVLIGERINPTGKKLLKKALIDGDTSYILNEGLNQRDKGVHILDVNVGIPDIDEKKMLTNTVCELQGVTDLPLQIDTSNSEAMECALRRYNGKAMINSVNGKEENMKAIFPLVKKYGGVVVALTLDENGIPENADERVKIAKKILRTAESYGINKKDIIFDTLAMTISADKNAANATLEALNIIKNELGCHTSLGVSNVSFGLPKRDIINSTFFALALENGLSGAIMNPYSLEMMKVYNAFCALKGYDDNCSNYIDFAASFEENNNTSDKTSIQTANENSLSELQLAVEKGLKEKAKTITIGLLKSIPPLTIVQEHIIPALDNVGKGFESNKIFLPQLLMSAEAAKYAFEEIKIFMAKEKSDSISKGKFVLATVKGDIHDIGKNIVKLLLENYGFQVIDLGKDVPPEAIVETVIKENAPIAGLSALMTTTVGAMEETIKLLAEKAPFCKVIVGGAVLNPEYAERIGADFYAKDAMETVKIALRLMNIDE